MDWRSVQGVPRLSPDDRWDRLQPPRDPTHGLSGNRKWMDGWVQQITHFFNDGFTSYLDVDVFELKEILSAKVTG